MTSDETRPRSVEMRHSPGDFDPNHDTIKVLTMQVSKRLEFPVVALMGAGQMPAAGEDERDEARLFYVGATRATQRLVIATSGNASFSEKLKNNRNERALWQP